MQVNGHKIQYAIRELEHRKTILFSQFKESIWTFNEDGKGDPVALMQEYGKIEETIVRLQTAQQRYNLAVKVGGQSLAKAVRLVGGLGRIEKAWRECAKDTGSDRDYGYRRNQRDTNTQYGIRTISVEQSIKLAREAAKRAAECREVIAVGNTTAVETSEIGITDSDFEI